MTRRPSVGLPAGARLRRHLQVIECRYPRAWEQLDAIRRLDIAASAWPSWCHVPLSRVREVVCPEDAAHDPTRLVDVAIVAGLAAWRVHKTVITADHAAGSGQVAPDALLDGAIDLDDVTPDRLQALLPRPVYIELPPATLGSPATGATRGAIVHLSHDERAETAELRLLIEPTRRWTLGSVPLVPLAVPLTQPTLARCLDTAVHEHLGRHDRIVRYAVAGEMAIALHGLVRVCVGLTVHLLGPVSTIPEPPARHAALADPRTDPQTKPLAALYI